jgi:hypothetical protein
MRSGINWIRLFVAVITVCGLGLAATPSGVSAQGNANPNPPQHKWKHDFIRPAGPPDCVVAARPCPGGLGTGGLPPGQERQGTDDASFPPGQSSNLVASVALSPGLEPSQAFVGALTSLAAAPASDVARHAVLDVFRRAGDPASTDLVRALTSRGNDGARQHSVALVAALRNLTVQDGQLPATVEAFNALVDASSDGFLADPAPEFVVVHSFIGALVDEALATSEGSR